jgi:hypothetical protein
MLGAAILLAATAVSSPHLGIAVAPASVVAPGNVSSSAQYTIYNPGNVKESVTMQVITMVPVANAPGKYAPDSEYDHYSVNTPTFTLAPHAHKSVTVTIKSDGYGHHLGVVAEATANQKGFARVHAEVVSKYTVTGPTAPNAPKAENVPTLHKSGTSPVVPIGALAGLSVALLAAWAWLRRRARRSA